MATGCLFCGGNASEPNHWLRCDGRQGRREASYPETAGWKATETSREAAETTDASTYRAQVYAWLRAHGPHTADEAASALGISILTVRPRVSELHAQARVEDTGERRLNRSHKRAIVWRACESA